MCIQWNADPFGSYSTMPGSFLYGSFIQTSILEVEDALRGFVSTVLWWIEDSDDPRAIDLRENWNAISESTPSEIAFARAAARLGLDPYETGEWPRSLPELVESSLSDDQPSPLVDDFLSVVRPETALPLWKWLGEISEVQTLSRSPRGSASIDFGGRAGQAGVDAARTLRRNLEIGESPIDSVASVARSSGIKSLEFEPHNHRPDDAIWAAVGYRNDRAVMIGPMPKHSTGVRFLEARGLFHALFTCGNGPRLVTRGHDWDQQASRGFAAELLAPRTALLKASSDDYEDEGRGDCVKELGQKFGVSFELIERQLQNAERYDA
jgi:Zn-dependent peptidase ImmA (M78 family)